MGISLLAITANGITKNTTRQDFVQATDLAEKGTDFIVRDIQKYLESKFMEKEYTIDQFEVLLNKILNDTKYSCSNGIKIDGENGNYSHSCIESTYKISNDNKDRGKLAAVIKSTGYANGKEKTNNLLEVGSGESRGSIIIFQ